MVLICAYDVWINSCISCMKCEQNNNPARRPPWVVTINNSSVKVKKYSVCMNYLKIVDLYIYFTVYSRSKINIPVQATAS